MDADILPQEGGNEGVRELAIVDGISNNQVEAWFREIDTKAKGYITPAEALLFFRRTSLPKETLSKVLSASSSCHARMQMYDDAQASSWKRTSCCDRRICQCHQSFCDCRS